MFRKRERERETRTVYTLSDVLSAPRSRQAGGRRFIS